MLPNIQTSPECITTNHDDDFNLDIIASGCSPDERMNSGHVEKIWMSAISNGNLSIFLPNDSGHYVNLYEKLEADTMLICAAQDEAKSACCSLRSDKIFE
jgi:hypothetical protein